MVKLMEHQLKQSLENVECARKLVDSKMEEVDSDLLGNYHYELLDVELRLKDMIKHIGGLEEFF